MNRSIECPAAVVTGYLLIATIGYADHPAVQPQVLIPGLKLELVAREPDLVTPIGLTFDHRGRLLVIESHTHFPPDEYAGPPYDRIRALEDTDGDGRIDLYTNFLEGPVKTMSLRRGPDEWIYVATRMQVFRTRDADGDGQADSREPIATLETEGDYPHNGLCGLCFDDSGQLYFGLGENLGASYTLIGRDGVRLSGGGEGGNIYRCTVEGTGLRQVATGFWNPFGICIDSAGRLFTVGNDPDASPPCRLVHVVEGGDYGFQFRYGRSGRHPLQAWDGELPGTLPMVAGTGEAPSAVLTWHGQLYASSWGEHRIERFTLKPHGASVRADREIVLQGDHRFRPVDLAIAPDGSLYFTDWVDRSYNVHGKGRLWRLSWEQMPQEREIPALSAAEMRAQQARRSPDWSALRSDDPFLHHAAMMAFRDSPLLTADTLRSLEHARERLGMLEAARRSPLPNGTRDSLLAVALDDADPSVRLYAVRWVADQRLTQFHSRLEAMTAESSITTSLYLAVIAAVEWLETGTVERGRIPGEAALIAALENHARPHLQALALKCLPPDHPSVTIERLAALVAATGDSRVQREAARTLALRPLPDAADTRRRLAGDPLLPQDVRADLRAGIAAETRPTASATSASPPAIDLDAWLARLAGPGDANRGWQVFFGQSAVRCGNCHRFDGRGADVGPDLTGIGRRMDRRRLAESILAPGREVAPRFVPWVLVSRDGRVLTGMSLGVVNGGEDERFLTSEGTTFDISIRDIASRRLTSQSIMPDNLHEHLQVQDLRDLLELLAQ